MQEASARASGRTARLSAEESIAAAQVGGPGTPRHLQTTISWDCTSGRAQPAHLQTLKFLATCCTGSTECASGKRLASWTAAGEGSKAAQRGQHRGSQATHTGAGPAGVIVGAAGKFASA